METIRGIVTRIIYVNDSNSYCVFLVQDYNEEYITCTYKADSPREGDELELKGRYVQHTKYGYQFDVSYVQRLLPDTVGGIKRYLANLGIKGLGEKSIEKIIAYFDEDCITILKENRFDEFLEVPGIRISVKEELCRALLGEGILSEINSFLENNGISSKWSRGLYQLYGSNTILVLRDNPYTLVSSGLGINFNTADTLASHLGFSLDDEHRISCAIRVALQSMADNGNTCIPFDELIGKIYDLLGGFADEIASQIQNLLEWGSIFGCTHEDILYLYSPELYMAESESTRILLQLVAEQSEVRLNIDQFWQDFEEKYNLTLGEEQKSALQIAVENRVSIITGGPGTGKTTIVKALVEAFQLGGLPRIILCAPTGRAAKRLSEATDYEATTIHRLLMPVQGSDSYDFMKNEDDPLDVDVIIIDEASMLNIQLFYAILIALPANTQIVIVGDVDQLPPIGPGFVLRDLLLSEVIPYCRLSQVYRQQNGNQIVDNAHLINEGKMPQISGEGEFSFIPVKTIGHMLETVALLYKKYREEVADELDVQVISPMRRGTAGSNNLSKVIQQAVNPFNSNVAEVQTNGIIYRVGDKVIQIINNYELEVFNGEVGIIYAISKTDIFIRFTDKDVRLSLDEIHMIMPAYAITVHKSQGSEYGMVIIPFVPPYGNMLQRNLLYTAVTRAKDKVIIVGTEQALTRAVHTVNGDNRYSLLTERLRGELDE